MPKQRFSRGPSAGALFLDASWGWVFTHVFHGVPARLPGLLYFVCVAIFMMLKIWSIIMTVFGDWRFSSLPFSLLARDRSPLDCRWLRGETKKAESSHTIKTRALRNENCLGKWFRKGECFVTIFDSALSGSFCNGVWEFFFVFLLLSFVFFEKKVFFFSSSSGRDEDVLSDAYWERNLFDRKMKNFARFPRRKIKRMPIGGGWRHDLIWHASEVIVDL